MDYVGLILLLNGVVMYPVGVFGGFCAMKLIKKRAARTVGLARVACRDIVAYEMLKELDTAVDEAENLDCDHLTIITKSRREGPSRRSTSTSGMIFRVPFISSELFRRSDGDIEPISM